MALKKTLLGLIELNEDEDNIDTNNNTTVGYFYISVESKGENGADLGDYYNITYTYNNNVITYSKTFKINSSES